MLKEQGRWGCCQDIAAATYFSLVTSMGSEILDSGYVIKVFWARDLHAFVVVEWRGNESWDFQTTADYAWLIDAWTFKETEKPITKIHKIRNGTAVNYRNNAFFAGFMEKAQLKCVFHEPELNPLGY